MPRPPRSGVGLGIGAMLVVMLGGMPLTAAPAATAVPGAEGRRRRRNRPGTELNDQKLDISKEFARYFAK